MDARGTALSGGKGPLAEHGMRCDWLRRNGWAGSAADNSSLIGQKRSRDLWPRQ